MNKALAGSAKNLEIHNFETLFADDSVCIMQYVVDAENYSGDKATLYMEYFLLWTIDNPKLVEDFYEMSETKSIMDKVNKFYNGELPNEKNKRSRSLRSAIPAFRVFSLKDVKEE